MRKTSRLLWILCRLGLTRACPEVRIEDGDPEIEEVKRRQREAVRRLAYLGYDLEAFTGMLHDEMRGHSDTDSAEH